MIHPNPFPGRDITCYFFLVVRLSLIRHKISKKILCFKQGSEGRTVQLVKIGRYVQPREFLYAFSLQEKSQFPGGPVAQALIKKHNLKSTAEKGAEEPALESECFRYRLLVDGTAEIMEYTGTELQLVLPELVLSEPGALLQPKMEMAPIWLKSVVLKQISAVL